MEFLGNSIELTHHSTGFVRNKNAAATETLAYKAAESITLKAGFEAKGGSDLHLKIEPIPTATDYEWQYQIADHLGNTRVLFADKDDDGLIRQSADETSNEVLGFYNYSAFGLELGGSQLNVSNNQNRLTYNGKEKIRFSGYLDYGARTYDPTIAMFDSVDPLAASMPAWGGYTYGFDNPIRFTDPTGMMPESPDWINNGDGTYTAEAGDSAFSLAQDAGISNARANSIVESQLGANYIGADGGLKSNVEVGDAVNVNTNEYTWSSGGSGVTPLLPARSSTASGGVSSSTVAGATADAAGGLGAGLTTQGGSVRLTNGAYNGNGLSPKYYASGWAGGSVAQIKTYNLGAVGKVAGKLGTAGTIGMGVIDVGSNGFNERGFGTQTQLATGRFAGSLGGGAAGAAFGASFLGIGAIPGGIIGGVIGGYGGSKAGEKVVETIQNKK